MTAQRTPEPLRMPAVIAWLFFAPGAALIIASIIRLQVDGLTVLGAVFLVIWAWLIGVFTAGFWDARAPRPVSPYLGREPQKWDELTWGSSDAATRAEQAE